MKQTPELQRRLGLFDATMLVVGSMIGSGIFLTLPIMARSVPAPGLLLGLWVFAGLFTLLGAISYAELATMFPHTGGQYVFIREAYGNFMAFLFGWTQFLVIQTGFIAAVAIAFAKYLGVLIPQFGEKVVLLTIPLGKSLPMAVQAYLPEALLNFQINSAQLVACAVIVVLTAVNIRGVREGAIVQNVFTLLKMGALAAIITAGLVYLDDGSHFLPILPPSEAIQAGFLAALAVAMSKVLFAYDAWFTVTYVAEEIHDAHRVLPRAMVLGCLVVMILYLLTNVAYLAVLPIDQIAAAREDRVAEVAAEAMLGKVGTRLVSAAILISTFGAINGLVLVGARVFYAMARDGLFIRHCSSLSPRGTPTAALLIQGFWAMVLTLTGSYSELLTYCTFASVLFGSLTVAAVYLLRFTQPDRPRPYRCWGYPVTPALYLIVCVLFLIYVVQGNPSATLIGSGLILTGIPFYWMWKVKRRKTL